MDAWSIHKAKNWPCMAAMIEKFWQDVLDKSSGGKEEKALCALQLNGSDRERPRRGEKVVWEAIVSSEHYTYHSHVSL